MEEPIYRLISLSGFFVIAGIAWLTGTRTKIKIETIIGSIFLAWVLGALTFWFSGSRTVLKWINDLLIALLGASQKAQYFYLAPLLLVQVKHWPMVPLLLVSFLLSKSFHQSFSSPLWSVDYIT
jgi:nucleoside permease NupC